MAASMMSSRLGASVLSGPSTSGRFMPPANPLRCAMPRPQTTRRAHRYVCRAIAAGDADAGIPEMPSSVTNHMPHHDAEYSKLKGKTAGPTSGQRDKWQNKMKKAKLVRNNMKKSEWNDLTFLNQCWELREVKPIAPKVAVKPSASEARKFQEAKREAALRDLREYRETKRQLQTDTTFISIIGVASLAYFMDHSAAISFSIGAIASLVYIRLLAASVDSMSSFEAQLGEALGTNAGSAVKQDSEHLSAAAPLRFAMPLFIILLAANWSDVGPQLGLQDVFDMQILPALGGLFTYKGGVVVQAVRSIRKELAQGAEGQATA